MDRKDSPLQRYPIALEVGLSSPASGSNLRVPKVSFLLAFRVYPMALIIPGLWCCGLLCFDSRLVGIMMGWCDVKMSFCRPSRVESIA